MDSLRLVVPPHPKLPSGSQHAQPPSDTGHEGEQQVNNQPRTHVDDVGHGQNRPTTRMEKDLPNVGKPPFLNTASRLMLIRSFQRSKLT